MTWIVLGEVRFTSMLVGVSGSVEEKKKIIFIMDFVLANNSLKKYKNYMHV